MIESPVGRLGIRTLDRCVRQIAFLDERYALRAPADATARGVVVALERYFVSPKHAPQVDVAVSGSAFRQRVWRALRTIPAGRVMTYGALAERLGTGARAVGNACRHNPVPVLVPCHRVVAAAGPGGFAGNSAGRLVDIKRRLLAHEGVEIGGTNPQIVPSRESLSQYVSKNLKGET